MITNVLPARGQETILLVEDNDDVRLIMTINLRNSGYTVLTAAHGKEALRIAQHRTFDLVLSDVSLPHLSGQELSERLSEQLPGLKVLLFSGYPESMIEEFEGRGPRFAFLQKPFTAAALTEKVREVLDA